MSIGDPFWLFFIFSAIEPLLQQKMLEAMRVRKISQLERTRKSRVILMVHRHQRFRRGSSRYTDDRSRRAARPRPAHAGRPRTCGVVDRQGCP